MVFILGASSLHHALESLPHKTKLRYSKTVFTLPGLSLNPGLRNPRKTVQFLLKKFFHNRCDIIIWHDVLNNSISKHVSSNYTCLSNAQLLSTLNDFSSKVKALVYCRRDGTPDIYSSLKGKFLTLNVVKDIISKRKAKDKSLLKNYRSLHQKHELELKTLSIILHYSDNLNRILSKSQPKRLNKRRRRALRKKLFPSSA